MAPPVRMLPDIASSASTSLCCTRPIVWGLFVEPDVFQAKIVDDAVDHHCPIFDPRLPAIGEAVVKNNRPRPVIGQLSLDLPYQLLSLSHVGLHRLPVEQFFELRIAIADVVARRAAGVVLVELLVGIIDAAASQVEADLEILAIHLGIPESSLDDLKLTVDEHLLQLVD